MMNIALFTSDALTLISVRSLTKASALIAGPSVNRRSSVEALIAVKSGDCGEKHYVVIRAVQRSAYILSKLLIEVN